MGGVSVRQNASWATVCLGAGAVTVLWGSLWFTFDSKRRWVSDVAEAPARPGRQALARRLSGLIPGEGTLETKVFFRRFRNTFHLTISAHNLPPLD